MKRIAYLSCGIAAALMAAALAAAEPEAPGEHELLRAQVLSEQGDLKQALTLLTQVLRGAKEDDLRTSAREELEHMGLNDQEIFKLDPTKALPEELDALIKRIGAYQAHQRRLHVDHDYAMEVLRGALVLRFDHAPEVQAAMQVKDAARAVEMLIGLALDEKGGDIARESQEFLEDIGVAGAKIETTRKDVAEGKLAEEVLKEATAVTLFIRLREYKEWRENNEIDEEQLLRQKIGKDFGLLIFTYLKTNHANSAAFRRNVELNMYWNGVAAERPEKVKAIVPLKPDTPAAEKTDKAQKTEKDQEPKF
ncbi:MAG: hypothetical protein HY291_22955 [Planctomycetes bacterium]|nr:hypothetical protein [Planctomycetota bacterium]